MVLTLKQEKFCLNVAEGMSQYDAYLDAYPSSRNWIRSTVDSRASELRHDGKIVGRINELNKPLIDKLEAKQDDLMSWAVKISTGEVTDAELKKLARTVPQVLNNLLNKLLATKSESKNEHEITGGIEEILKKVESNRE